MLRTKNALPMGTIVLILVLALAAVGVGYGLWSKTLFLHGVVNTGNVDAELSIERILEDEDEEVPAQQDLPRDPDDTIEGKDIADCRAELSATNQLNDTLTITIEEGYPSFDCWVTFDVHSTGSVPIHIHRPVFDPIPPEITVVTEECYAEDTQLHFSERAFCTLRIHVEQIAEQNASYTFWGTVFVHQYNEEAP